MKKILLLGLIVCIFLPNTQAQNSNEKISDALRQFMQTEFMQQYSDLRIQAESEASNLIANASMYEPQDVTRVQIAYDRTAQRFNGLLDKIKGDFLDNQKLKFITRFPEDYSRGLELDIRELSDFYSQNLQQTLADVTNNQQDGSALLLLLMDLVKFSSTAIQHFSKIKQEARRYTDSYLTTHLVKPNRFKTWNEISNGGFETDPYNDPYQNNTDPYSDPYQNNNTDPYTDPYQNNNTDPYTDPYQNNTNTDPYSDPYQNSNYDGVGKPDSLKKYFPADTSKLKKSGVDGANPARIDTSKTKRTYDQYKVDQRKKTKKTTKKN